TLQAAQTLSVTPNTLTFSYTTGLAVPPAQTFQVASSGSQTPITVAAQAASGGTWLSASSSSATAPATVTVSVAPHNLSAGNYTGTVTISSAKVQTPQTVTVNLSVVAIPPPNATAIVNAASFAPGSVAPGEVITLGGTGLGPTTLAGPVVTGD